MWLDILKKMKKESGKTAKELSEMTGIPKSTIDKLFSGQTKEPYLSMVRSIVYALGYTLDDLDDTKESTIHTTNSEDDVQKKKLLENYEKLNENAQYTLVRYSDFLTEDRANLKDDYNCDKMNA